MELLVDVSHVDPHFGPFGDIVSVGARYCTVWADCTIGLEIILACTMELLGDVGQVESCFRPFGDSANLDAR
jgi:hypothetical protein